MKTTLLILIAAFTFGCSKDDDSTECNCEGQFINDITGETMHQPTDCEGTNAPEGYSFVECLDGPDY